MNESDLERQLQGWSLTTAEIMYRMPDHLNLLQSYVWQEYDLAPRFPRLLKFLNFWSNNLDGPLAQVRVAHTALIGPTDLRLVDAQWQLH